MWPTGRAAAKGILLIFVCAAFTWINTGTLQEICPTNTPVAMTHGLEINGIQSNKKSSLPN